MRIQPVASPIVPSVNRHPSANGRSEFTSFKGWNMDGGAILRMSHSELKNLAEYFHKSPEEVLLNISVSRNGIGIKNTEESMRAYEKLKRAVDEIRYERVSLGFSSSQTAADRLRELNEKASLCREKFYTEPAGFSMEDPVDLASIHWP